MNVLSLIHMIFPSWPLEFIENSWESNLMQTKHCDNFLEAYFQASKQESIIKDVKSKDILFRKMLSESRWKRRGWKPNFGFCLVLLIVFNTIIQKNTGSLLLVISLPPNLFQNKPLQPYRNFPSAAEKLLGFFEKLL